MTKSDRLRELADVLGVPVTAFRDSKEIHHLHVDADGKRWLLTLDAQGKPIVCSTGGDVGHNTAGESVSLFLRCGEESPQRDALTALIDQLLVAHLKH
ncbi:hypothetical protein GU700_05285 [Methylobacterium sp. NI91]|nr:MULTISPECIES: hypothetical protein [unclassified Methylobacterium]QIJ74044.1 hypothetical protein CLZ_05285 [Methylobacterium sp. CLZ]QIJ78950.1 hypothetical protein GU700_05285 [Methylobacterium sp. NI91]